MVAGNQREISPDLRRHPQLRTKPARHASKKASRGKVWLRQAGAGISIRFLEISREAIRRVPGRALDHQIWGINWCDAWEHRGASPHT